MNNKKELNHSLEEQKKEVMLQTMEAQDEKLRQLSLQKHEEMKIKREREQ